MMGSLTPRGMDTRLQGRGPLVYSDGLSWCASSTSPSRCHPPRNRPEMLHHLKRHPALTHIVQLFTGTAMAQAIPIVVSPILTRLYEPRAFGALGIFAALLLGLSLVVSGRFEVAVPIPTDDETAFQLVVLSLAVTGLSIVLLVVVAAVAAIASSGRPIGGLSPFAVLALPFGILFASAQQSFSYWLTRGRRFSVIARARVAQSVITVALSIALGLSRAVPDGLIVSLVLGYATALAVLASAVLSKERHRLSALPLAALKRTARRYVEFPTLNSAGALLDTGRDSGTLIIFSALFGVPATGLLSQALRITRAPMSLIGQSVAQVFYQHASSDRAAGRPIMTRVRRTMVGLAAVSLPIYLIVLVAGPALFAFVFGEPWRQAGEYARLLTPWLLLSFVLSPISLLPVMLGRQSTALALNGVDTALRLSAIVAGARFGGPIFSIIGFTAAGAAMACVQLWWYVRLAATSAAETRSAA